MNNSSPALGWPILRRASKHSAFSAPVKRINDGDDLNFFLASAAYHDLLTWLHQLNRAMFPTKDSTGKPMESRLDSPPQYSSTITNLRGLLGALKDLIAKAPPDTGPRRFGNVSFRTWSKLAEENSNALLDAHLDDVLSCQSDNDSQRSALREEITVYLLGSFGSAQRLDYGTGHELSFLAFLACLWKLGAFQEGEERAIVVGVIQPYLELIRTLVMTYTLEPAGSHGVWGLDDHSFIPYIFGSAQLGPAIEPKSATRTPTEGSYPMAPAPSVVTSKPLVADHKDSNMYFSAIQFIYEVKTGPFWEHSRVLFDISGIKDGWGKINKGMLKMYAAEVLGKFPVVQHFPFGSLFAWEADPEVAKVHASMHAAQQPKSRDVPPPPSAGGSTKAPWANTGTSTMLPPGSALPRTAAARAPPTKSRAPGIASPGTAAPWAAARQRPQ